METIAQPDLYADETEYIRHYWKWFPEVGSGNYVKENFLPDLLKFSPSDYGPDKQERMRRFRKSGVTP